MKTAKVRNSIKNAVKHLVANNPAYDREFNIHNGMDKDAVEFAKSNTLYDMKEIYGGRYGYRITAAGNRRERDEPNQEVQFKQSDLIQKKLQTRRAEAARKQLKNQNKVPIRKDGTKTCEEFCNEGFKKKTNADNPIDLQNIYNASFHLTFENWLVFLIDEIENSTI